MKRTLLLFCVMIAMQIIIAQQTATLPAELKDKAVKSDYVRPWISSEELPVYKVPNAMVYATRDGVVSEEIIGTTFYDLQTNGSLQNRIHCYDDGSIGAVWTLGLTATTFPDRGTGYNYYNGASWGLNPTQRIETFRAGWPSYAPWGPNGEIVVSHDFSGLKLYFMTRPEKGTGTWTQSAFTYSNGPAGLSWPRMTTSGDDHNTIHLLGNTNGEYQGQPFGIVYSRSTDGGASWNIENEVLPGTGADYYTEITADQYVWANPVGNTIAFLVCDAWHDMFMMKSTDNGDSWEKTVIWEHPYPLFDWEVTVTDTIFCVDNSASIALDNTGKAHVAFGISRVIHDVVGTTYSYYPYVDGVGYWNEDMPVFSNDLNALAPPQYGYPTSELIEDVNYIGWTQDIDNNGEITFIETATGFPMSYRALGVSGMPTISIGPDNWIVVIYSSTTELYHNTLWNFKKLWMRHKAPGADWGFFTHLTQDIFHIFDESIYAVANPTWEDYIHVLYNNDGAPGTGLDEDHDYIENMTTYMKVELYDVGIKEDKPQTAVIASLAIYPNPTKTMIKANYTLTLPSHVNLKVSDISGRVFIQKDLGNKNKGVHMYSIDLENVSPGIYFISLEADHQVLTQKLLVN